MKVAPSVTGAEAGAGAGAGAGADAESIGGVWLECVPDSVGGNEEEREVEGVDEDAGRGRRWVLVLVLVTDADGT